MSKEILYRIEFEGAESELKKLIDIRDELDKIAIEKLKLDKYDTEAFEKNKLQAQELQKQYRAEQQAIKDKQKEQKAVAGSLEQLRLEAKRLGKELEKTWAVGTPEFKKAAAGLEEVNRKIRNADKSAGNFKSNIGNYAGSIGDAFQGIGVNVGSLTSSLGAAATATNPLSLGLVALVGGAQLFGKALNATDAISDKFAETMGGAREALDYFFRSLATGDFSNFLTNIGKAIEEGKRYVKALDVIGDRTRAIQIIEAGDRERLAELQILRRSATESVEDRIKYSAEILSIELKNANLRKQLAADELDNELTNASKRSGLSKERVKQLLIEQETNRESIKLANAYNEALKSVGSNTSGSAMYGQTTTTQNKEALKVIQQTTPEIKKLAGELTKLGNIGEESYIKVADAFDKVGTENASFLNTTARTQVALSKLKKGQLDDIEEEIDLTKLSANEANKANEQKIADAQELLAIQLQLNDATLKSIETLQAYFDKRKEEKDRAKAESDAARRVQFGNTEEANVPDNIDTAAIAARAGQTFDIAATVDAASQFVSIWGDAYNQREQELKLSLDQGLINEKQYNKEIEKLQKKQANIQRTLAIAQLSVDMARTLSALGLGAANTAKVGFPYNIPLLIAFAAQAVGIIANLKAIKFAEGGLIAGGKPHSMGGTKFVGSDGSAFEAEQGEYIAVVNKHDTRRIGALSELNSLHGRPFHNSPGLSYFAQGGMFTPNTVGVNINSDMIRQIVSQVGTIPVVLSTNKIEQTNRQQRKVETIGSL